MFNVWELLSLLLLLFYLSQTHRSIATYRNTQTHKNSKRTSKSSKNNREDWWHM